MNKKLLAICAAFIVLISAIFLITRFSSPDATFTFAYGDELSSHLKTVYLTFDDGPSDRVTPKILDVLKENDVKATFFIIGQQAEKRIPLLQRIHDEGHALAVHSYTHDYKSIYANPQALLEDIDRCNKIIKQITGKPSTVYRFPGGSFGRNLELLQAVTAHGLYYVDWNASVRDAELWKPTPNQLYNAAIHTTSDENSIVLLAHDSTDKLSTAQALPKIIDYYRKNGYVFATF